MKYRGLFVLTIVLALLLAACGSDDGASVSATDVPTRRPPTRTPTAAPVAAAPTAAPLPAAKPGSITGRVHLMAPPTPPMVVYAVDTATGVWASMQTQQTEGEAPFTLPVPPGTYQVIAAVANGKAVGVGYYDASGAKLGTVAVAAGQTVADIEVRPPSQNECGSMVGFPASPDGRFAATAGPSQECVERYARPPLSTQPVRIQFAPGATLRVEPQGEASARLTGTLAAGGLASYVLQAGASQEMTVKLTATLGGKPVPASAIAWLLRGADGTPIMDAWDTEPLIPSDSAGPSTWQGQLPTTQDYYIDVALPALEKGANAAAQAPVNYTLEVSVSALPAGAASAPVLPVEVPLGFQGLFGLSRYIMLPPRFPASKDMPAVQPYVLSADNGDYDISLDLDPACHGATVCHYGCLSGKAVAANQPESTPNFVFEPDRAQKVTLAKNIEGYFILGQCGASCDDSKVFWVYAGRQYMIGLKGAAQKAVVDLVNAAIQNSITTAQ